MAEVNLPQLEPGPVSATAITHPVCSIALSYSELSKHLSLVVSSLSTHSGSPAFYWNS